MFLAGASSAWKRRDWNPRHLTPSLDGLPQKRRTSVFDGRGKDQGSWWRRPQRQLVFEMETFLKAAREERKVGNEMRV